MPTTRSLLRLRLIQLIYLTIVLLVAGSEGRALPGPVLVLLQAIAFTLVILAVLGRLWVSAFIAGHKDEKLVQVGPFAACRHPLYLFSMIGALGIGLATARLGLALGLPLIMAVILVWTARQEDRDLAQRYGQRWLDYAAAVPAFLPRASLLNHPNTVLLHPGIYRKAYFDAAAFLGLWLLIMVTGNLRQLGTWPTLFTLQ